MHGNARLGGIFILSAILLSLVPAVHADSVPSKVKQGNRRYDQKMYEQALQLYSEALQQQPDRRELNYNLANTLYRMDKHGEAATEMKKAAGTENSDLRRKAAYNLGNALFKAGQFQQAADQYTQVLQMDPGDLDAKYNLELALRKIEEQQNQKSQDKDKKQQDQSKQGEDKEKQDQANPSQQQQSKQDKQQPNRDESRQGEDTRRPQDPKGLSRQDAERLLQAMEAKEREELERQLLKVRRGTVRGRDW
jgi:Ca-activated chloride channel family protein